MTDFIKKLPPVFQTTAQKKFFDATFDQVFTKKDGDLLTGYIGRRNPGSYNPLNDYYVPEPSKNRTWWQLEPTAYAKNQDATKSNIFFYDDLLEKIDYLGGNTLNQNRLFESEYYSFGPPIDYDMFVNYQNYFWVPGGLEPITITSNDPLNPITHNDIINSQSYTTPATATPPNLTLSSGMTIVLPDDPDTTYLTPHVVQNVGGCSNLVLSAIPSNSEISTGYEFLPWDNKFETEGGRVIDNENWDENSWNVQPRPLDSDYITIERGGLSSNQWSSTNCWYHIDIINTTRFLTGSDFPQIYIRAQRPIIQFSANLVLYPGQIKTTINQPPKFMLYDHDGIPLNDSTKYPNSSFEGSEIFSYKLDDSPGANLDLVLSIPLTYIDLGQLSDIVFENDLMTVRYNYAPDGIYSLNKPNIDGYYYYKFETSDVLYNNWNLYKPCECADGSPSSISNCIGLSKQRVIDKYVVGYGTENKFKLSVIPDNYPSAPDIIVSVNGIEVKNNINQANGYYLQDINGQIYVNLSDYLTSLFVQPQDESPVVEIQTFTLDTLLPSKNGYFQIPQQLQANPLQEEVFDLSLSQLTPQFVSIIQNQSNFFGSAFGGNSNNYRDTLKDRSLGTYILQNKEPALKSMLISSSEILDFITAVRFSQEEYTKFKNKFVSTAKQLIDSEFSPVQYYENTIVISSWFEEILSRVNISKEFSNAFAYSYMIANGTPYSTEIANVSSLNEIFTLSNYVDLDDLKNSLYIYDVTTQENLLIIGKDYDIIQKSPTIKIQIKSSINVGDKLLFRLYKNPLPAYIPSTPSKLGTYSVYHPRIEIDNSYVIPTNVIIGHDGSKTIAYGDYRDQLLLELEKRIYNLILSKYQNNYYLPLRLENVKSGYFRKTRYSRDEYLEITEQYLNKWASKNRANYRLNEWDTLKDSCPINSLWKLYNYSTADIGITAPSGSPEYKLYGNWKGIFQYYYDTINPNTKPWEMLGLSEKPTWWESEYGSPVLNTLGEDSWPNSLSYSNMWEDIELGIIRQGKSAIYDTNGNALPQPTWARPGLSYINPVNATGDLRPVPDIFNITIVDDYFPFSGFDSEWKYGDGAPVEQAWMSTSSYSFSIQEFLYIMKPSAYGEIMWDTAGTELSPGVNAVSGISGPVIINDNYQFVQNGMYDSSDIYFKWFRPKNRTQIVHAETINNEIQIRFGYQRWISDRILFLNQSVELEFGQKIRTLDVCLANKFSGFTNKATLNAYIESASAGTTSNTLQIPSNNFDVILHKSQPLTRHVYSGVIIRALADGTFSVYGYDLLNSEFTIINRSNEKLIEVTIGGTPKEFKSFTANTQYNAGDIVKYNSVYYISNTTQSVQIFSSGDWQKLKGLPINGGISVTYKPVSLTTTTTLPYGSILKTPQDVFDMLIGWGAYLESKGWKFNEVDQQTNQLNDWLYSAKQFLFWLNSGWAPDSSIQLSPASNKATLVVSRGYPNDIEVMSNGVYNILNKHGIAIKPMNTTVDRDGQQISISPNDLSVGGIFFTQIYTSETEHVLLFDNITSFNDVIYNLLLNERQQRLKIYGFRSNKWYGKMEAPGYLVFNNQLIPNYETIVSNMRLYYDENAIVDNTSVEDLGRHLIGYENKKYLDNLQVSNDIQYLFYQGFIRQKGTAQTFEKLFRSQFVQNQEVINVYEEWALKLGDFGNTIDQVSTEIVINPEENAGDVIVTRLNFVPSTIGFIKEIKVINSENVYTTIPTPVIAYPDATPNGVWTVFSSLKSYKTGDIVRYDDAEGNPVYYSSKIEQVAGVFNPNNWEIVLQTRRATAFIVLNANGTISRVDITDPGYGYTSNPEVTINSGSQPNNLDKLYAIYQGQILRDETFDNIIDIDIDDSEKWIVRPNYPSYSLTLPETDSISYSLPNAGYVNFNDVDWYSFNILQTAINWGTSNLNPKEMDTIWIAKTFDEDWSVYKLINFNNLYFTNDWKIVEQNGQLLLLTLYNAGSPEKNNYLVPQYWNSTTYNKTDFGNMLVLQQIVNNKIINENNYTVAFIPYISEDYLSPGTYVDPDTLEEYNAYLLVTLDNEPITTSEIPNFEDLNTLLVYKSMRFMNKPAPTYLPTYVGYNDLIWVDDDNGKWKVLKALAERDPWDSGGWGASIEEFWGADAGWDLQGPFFYEEHRIQQPLLNTSLFKNVTVFTEEDTQIAVLPIYDPFKNILPGPAKQNLTYITEQDPARYNVSDNLRLFDDNTVFGPSQVGTLWWDTSEIRYVYYEQPKSSNESSLENLLYRRNNWGKIFPGSTVKIYEWVKSPVPPAEYIGSGTPKDVNSYVVTSTSDRFTNQTVLSYYFWVLNPAERPNAQNRTMAALDVALLLQNPKTQGYSYFSPIQQTDINNSYIFYNIQELLAYKGNNVQLQYRLSEREDQKHTQWEFFREGDKLSLISDIFWDKMVDSLCGYTKILPTSDEYNNAINIFVNNNDFTFTNPPIGSPQYSSGMILPVPDPILSEEEKYGINFRPRQTMFKNISSARKIFVQAANEILKFIPIRDDNPNWINQAGMVYPSQFWQYTNWYKLGFENAKPTKVFETIPEIISAVSLANSYIIAGDMAKAASILKPNDIIQVTKAITDTGNNRFILYLVTQNSDTNLYSVEEIGSELSAIKLLDTVYTTLNRYELSMELRLILNAFKTTIMINEYFVGQNELFGAMMNFVLSEQKNVDWVFKSSYIYIEEKNVPLIQNELYSPDQLTNILAYIRDSKPYHTKIRDYSSQYSPMLEFASGNVVDILNSKTVEKITDTINIGQSTDGLVINVDTKLPVNDISGSPDILGLSPAVTCLPLNGWGKSWDGYESLRNTGVGNAILEAGGSLDAPWDISQNVQLLDNTISFKNTTNSVGNQAAYRNANVYSGVLIAELSAPLDSGNGTISVFVDPATHPFGTDIFPAPPNAVWINGERIVYNTKTLLTPNSWQLGNLNRGTLTTGGDYHSTGSVVFTEAGQEMPELSDYNVEVWNTANIPAIPDITTQQSSGVYTSISSVPDGGIWYSSTVQATFLTDKQGKSIN